MKKTILSVIQSRDAIISASEISQVTKFDNHYILDCIANMRRQGIPIISKRNTNHSGFMIASNEDERNKCVAMLTSQYMTMMRNIDELAKVDLNNWHKLIKE